MIDNPEIINELQKINQRLTQLTSPRKIAGRQFLSGIFHSLGSALGTLIVILAAVYLLSKIDFGDSVNTYIQKLVPKATEISVPLSVPSPGQL